MLLYQKFQNGANIQPKGVAKASDFEFKPDAAAMKSNIRSVYPDGMKYGEMPYRSKMQTQGKRGFTYGSSVNENGLDLDIRGGGLNYEFPITKSKNLTLSPGVGLTNVQGRMNGNSIFKVTQPNFNLGVKFKF